MNSNLALVFFVAFVLWLFVRNRKERAAVSFALWIPLVWTLIIGSRPASLWFSGALASSTEGDDLEGSAFDRNILLFLILAGLWILRKRRVRWSAVFSHNKWVFLFYLFFGLSVLWSDYPFVSFKRWIKIFGHVVMVLVILSERDPVAAIKAVFLRCSFVLIPLSVLLIKFYPNLGRGYSRFTYEPICIGVALGKNELGITVVVCGLFVFWELLDLLQKKPGGFFRVVLLMPVILLAMALWLLKMAHSATSLACTVLGAASLFAMRLPAIQKQRRHFVASSVVGVLLLLLVSTALDLGTVGAGMLGRDASLTGRTEIWNKVIAEQPNPVIGVGFYSFWLGERAEKMSEKYFFRLNQAHNGYLETYLDGGVIGVGILIAMLVSAGAMIQRRLIADIGWGSVAITFWFIVIIHNWTEATFGRLNLLWFVLLLVSIKYTRSASAKARSANSKAPGLRNAGRAHRPGIGDSDQDPSYVLNT